ncbi:MAG: hypothetical protein COT71_04210 [Candidatus Andersenbacteria bacterium CG10_big_fil_rev_8_21_14_0_10_54_11]|uniref:Uncharacterized protein n=1 Tax=Candidatus Andersenbacteria bacterium CG10_big_fil_rev_8_21_14_0_10_54_11 TaxID=1974485 RepID=A0A2M6WYF2_9BACT|nr:MAG: hypothetical protein COT71_04210 [Candidatus Andersenbacteria bacterium CG10_big_fil_rev_8_21_14_0_10_54_11]
MEARQEYLRGQQYFGLEVIPMNKRIVLSSISIFASLAMAAGERIPVRLKFAGAVNKKKKASYLCKAGAGP